mmetsp:Transcript_13597/g.19988  ORF Transcript_13597/g.19988 Transcript_13597/m.19988 type:complete len:247 (-) Transcript_13597:573-1313(-)
MVITYPLQRLFYGGLVFSGIASAFLLPSGPINARSVALRRPMVVESSFSDAKPVLITGNNIEVTPALMDYVNKKVDKIVDKVGADVTKVDVHLNVNKNPRISNGHVAEVTVFAKGAVIRASESTEGMYGSIDLVTDRLARKLRKFKERRIDAHRGKRTVEAREEADMQTVLGNEKSQGEVLDDYYVEDDVVKVDMSIVKSKSFEMPPMSVRNGNGTDQICLLDGYFLHFSFIVAAIFTVSPPNTHW